MSRKMKTCPVCGQDFYQLKRQCCPHCGVALTIVKKKLLTQAEVIEAKRKQGDSKAVLNHYLSLMRKQGSYLTLPIGTTAWIKELCFAKALITDSYKFLGYNDRHDLDPTQFAIAALDYMFNDQGRSAWLKDKNTLRTCNGGTFFQVAPLVLKKIAQAEAQDRADRLFSAQSPIIGVPILG
jgi:hypothetical protein